MMLDIFSKASQIIENISLLKWNPLFPWRVKYRGDLKISHHPLADFNRTMKFFMTIVSITRCLRWLVQWVFHTACLFSETRNSRDKRGQFFRNVSNESLSMPQTRLAHLDSLDAIHNSIKKNQEIFVQKWSMWFWRKNSTVFLHSKHHIETDASAEMITCKLHK